MLSLKEPADSSLYSTLWRWHFYAGIFCLPFVLALSLSGAIYLFKPQIEQWQNQSYQHLPIQGTRASASAQIDAAVGAVSGSVFVNYQLTEHNNQAVVITLNAGHQRTGVVVHPYTLEVLDVFDVEKQFIRLVRTFHGELLVGNVGSILVELAGCWAIVLIITGLFLWWPRHAKGFAGVIYPRFNKSARVFWRDLHAVTGVWIAVLVLFLLLSALPWTLVWGSVFKELRQIDKPHHTQEQSWSLGRAEEQAALEKKENTNTVLNDKLLASAQSLNFASPVLLSVSKNDPTVWVLKSQHQNRPLRATAWLDATSGDILRQQHFEQRSLTDRIIGIAIAAHEGQLFGWFNQLLGVITALGLSLMCISGFVLWRKRKPEKTLGAPRSSPNAKVGKMVGAIVLLLALLLPLLALSLICILVFEYLARRFAPSTHTWLGLKGN